MKEDVGTSSPKKYANKVGMVLTQEINVGLNIKQTTSLHKYLHYYKAKDKELYLCRVIWKWFV